MARQVLSLVAGGAIDEWLLSHLRALRQEHATARLLHALQQQLWPGGAWFQSLPENQHPVRAQNPKALISVRLLHALQQQLWPGGAWFQSLPKEKHPARARKP